MAQFIITKTLSAQDKNSEAFRSNIAQHMEACKTIADKHNAENPKDFKAWLKSTDAKLFANAYEVKRIWKDEFYAILALGKLDGDAAKLFCDAQDALIEMGKTSREFTYTGAKKLVVSFVNGTGKFKAKTDDADADDADADDETETVETLDKDKRSAQSIAANFFDIANNAQANTAEILAEFAKLVEASRPSDTQADKEAA